MEITIKPADNFLAEIETNQGAMLLGQEDTISLLENGKAAGYSFTIILRSGGYRLDAQVEKKAFELAGLGSFEQAKYTANSIKI